MIIGANRVFNHEDKEYHIQAEDLGVDQACFEVRVYIGGSVLWRKQVSYADVVGQSLPKAEQEEALSSMMNKTITTVQAAIAKGKIS